MKMDIGRTVACPKHEMEIGRMALISHRILYNEHYLLYSIAVVASSTRNGITHVTETDILIVIERL